MQKEKGFIKYGIIIVVIMALVVLSQQPFFKDLTKHKLSGAKSSLFDGYFAKGSDWVNSQVIPKVSGEVQKRGDMIKQEVQDEKEKISENIGTKIKNYFSGIVDSVVNPGKDTNINCESQPATSTR